MLKIFLVMFFCILLVAVMMTVPIIVLLKNPDIVYKLHQEETIVLDDRLERVSMSADLKGNDYGLH